MDGWLKALLTIACVTVIAVGGFWSWTEYDRRQAAAAYAADVEARRAAVLYQDGCRSTATKIFEQNEERPITSPYQLSSDLLRDIRICIKKDLMFAFEKNEIQRTGLISVLAP